MIARRDAPLRVDLDEPHAAERGLAVAGRGGDVNPAAAAPLARGGVVDPNTLRLSAGMDYLRASTA